MNNSIFIQDPEVASSNEKYLIESLRSRLLEVTDEKNNMQMVLDFHLTELEDKKSKVIFGYNVKTTKLSLYFELISFVIFICAIELLGFSIWQFSRQIKNKSIVLKVFVKKKIQLLKNMKRSLIE